MKECRDQFIVVTGASGFIGSGVVRYLNDKGFENIIVVDEMDHSDKWQNLVGKKFVDILEKQALFQWLEGRQDSISAFIHLGACSNTVETDSAFLLQNNYQYTKTLAQYALKHNKRFIYASSAATYGMGDQGFKDDHDKLHTLHPLNMYGYSKQLFDLWAAREGVLDRVVGLKYFNVYGPNEYHKGRMASAITKMLPQIQKEGKINLFKSSEPHLYKDGDQKRDFIYVKDAVRMTCEFLWNNKSGIYNIGAGKAATWNDLAKAVFKAVEKPANIEYIEMPNDLIGKYQNFTEADMAKTSAALGKSSQTIPLEKAVVEYVQDYLMKGSRW